MFNNKPTNSRRTFLQLVLFAGIGLKIAGVSKLVDLKARMSLTKKIAIHEESTEGGQIVSFFNHEKQIENLEIVQCWESGRNFLGILISNERIISAEQIVEQYNVPFYITKETAKEIGSEEYFDERKSRITRDRFIFKNNKICQSIDNPINEYENRTLVSLEENCANRVQQALICLDRL